MVEFVDPFQNSLAVGAQMLVGLVGQLMDIVGSEPLDSFFANCVEYLALYVV